MKKVFIATVMLMSCLMAMAQQQDGTNVEKTAKGIGKSTQSNAQQPTNTQQSNRMQWFTIGAKIGYNISFTQDKFADLYTIHTGLRHGGSTGLFMRLGTNVYCQPEVLYTFSIYDEKRIIGGDSLSRPMQNHTIDIPVLLGYSPICSEKFKFRVMAGPRFAFNVNKNSKYDVVATSNKDQVTVSATKCRLGLDCGIGLDFWRINVDIRYTLMQDVFKYQYNTESNGWKRVNFLISTLNISVGYNIWGNNMPGSKKQKYDPNAQDYFKKN